MMLLVGLGTVQADSSPGLRAGPNVPERHKFFLTACSSVMKTLIQNNDPSFIYSAFVECSNDLGLLDAADVFFALVDEKNSENLPYQFRIDWNNNSQTLFHITHWNQTVWLNARKYTFVGQAENIKYLQLQATMQAWALSIGLRDTAAAWLSKYIHDYTRGGYSVLASNAQWNYFYFYDYLNN